MHNRLLHAHFHEDLEADAEHARGKSIAAYHFGEIFAVHGHGVLGVGQSDEEAHANFVAKFAGLKVNAAARNTEGSAHVVEVVLLRIGRANTHELRDFAAATAAAFCRFRCGCCGSSGAGCLAHNALLGLHESPGLSPVGLFWKECKAGEMQNL